jgi:hypothetical protein
MRIATARKTLAQEKPKMAKVSTNIPMIRYCIGSSQLAAGSRARFNARNDRVWIVTGSVLNVSVKAL